MADEGGGGARGQVEVVELTAAQQSFARRVAESKATVPHLYFERDLPSAPAIAALLAAAGEALREVPLLNSAYRDGRVEIYSRINIAFAVAASGTLAFPVVHDADRKDATQISTEIEALSTRVIDGSITSPELAGATFTVIDMSAGGVSRFAPIIGRGQSATLGAGAGALTLACDNRVVQADEGGRFLDRVAILLA
jgi:pyruvate dehydrogenase E2 component (dihydrolipoyllysine-residue acetyltransferase)